MDRISVYINFNEVKKLNYAQSEYFFTTFKNVVGETENRNASK